MASEVLSRSQSPGCSANRITRQKGFPGRAPGVEEESLGSSREPAWRQQSSSVNLSGRHRIRTNVLRRQGVYGKGVAKRPRFKFCLCHVLAMERKAFNTLSKRDTRSQACCKD